MVKVNILKTGLIAFVICIGIALCAQTAYGATYSESESNDYISTADTVNVTTGNQFKGNLADYDDQDFVKFTLSQGSEINLDIYGSKPKNVSKYGNSVMIDIYKATSGNNTPTYIYGTYGVYNSNLGYIAGNETIYLSQGTYYLKLYEQFTDEKISYTLTFKTKGVENFSEPNDFISQATQITEGKKYFGILESYDNYNSDYEYDFFVANLQSKGTYYAVIRNENIEGYNFSAKAMDSATNSKYIFDGESYVYVPTGKTEVVTVSLPAGKTYFRFDSYAYSGKYEFALVKKLSAPKSVSVKLYGHDDVKATWSPVNGAAGYYVYYKKSSASSYSYLGKYTGTAANIKNLSDGSKYYVKVIPYKLVAGTSYKGFSKTSSSVYTLKKVSTPKLSKSGSKVKVKWTNISGESGYQISKSTKKSGTNIVSTYKTTSGTYKTVSASKGKTYYYKVRAYKTVDGKKIYGPWSATKSYKRK